MGFLLVAGSKVSILFPLTYHFIFNHNQSVVCPRPKWGLQTCYRTQRDSSAVFINWVTGLKRGISHLNWRYRTGFTSFYNPHSAVLVVPTRKDVMLFNLLMCLQWPAPPSSVRHTVPCTGNSVPSTYTKSLSNPLVGHALRWLSSVHSLPYLRSILMLSCVFRVLSSHPVPLPARWMLYAIFYMLYALHVWCVLHLVALLVI
jgi:hypothetical protein